MDKTATDHKVWKESILKKAKEKQKSLIHDFRLRIRDILKNELPISEEGMDLDRQALDDMGKQEVTRLANQLNFAVEEMDLLNKIKIELPLHNRIQLGSVVITEDTTIFVSVSLEEFVVEGKKIFGISTKAPVYKEMAGKKVGDGYLGQTISDVF